jgi:hypothetical protein
MHNSLNWNSNNNPQVTYISGILTNISNLIDKPTKSQKKYFLPVDAQGLPQFPNLSTWKGVFVHDKKVNQQYCLWESPLGQSAVCKSEQSVYRAELDWMFAPKVATLSDRAIAYLIQLEAHEGNPHVCADLRQSQITLILAQRGNAEPATVASYQVHRCHPDQVWPRRVAERKAKLAAEFSDWFDAAGNLRPDVPKKDSAATQTPLPAETEADHPHVPASARSASVLHFPKKETA